MYDCISAGCLVYWRKNLAKKFKDTNILKCVSKVFGFDIGRS